MTSALIRSDTLHARARAIAHAFERNEPSPEPFDALALDLVRFQADHVPGYARLCGARGIDAHALTRSIDAPAVPTDAFKLARVFAFDDELAQTTFRTSGTTVGARGAHFMRDVRTYDAVALAFGRASLGLREPVIVLVIGPPPETAPDSSLTHMWATFAGRLGIDDGHDPYFIRGDAIAVERLKDRIASLSPDAPALVLSTSFAMVHLLDRLGDAVMPLPAGSRLVHTGGFKGRSREVSSSELRRAMARAFAVGEPSIFREYGMTELSSQFWEGSGSHDGIYAEPPWARVIPVDPVTLLPVPEGSVGIARIEDLANVDSAFAVVAQDRVRRARGGFELLGRLPGAPPRGCSIALDEILSREPP